ncbi:MAG: ARMT1-like domain-containing protein [Aquificota bacterium]|nr:ARMT1-like domain-containing protein [Aquificota bacterium]
MSGSEDPFRLQKKQANSIALGMLPELEGFLEREPDGLAYALKVSAVGNYIDFAIRGEVDPEDVLPLLESEFVVWDYGAFKGRLGRSEKILIVGDNAGEIALDMILVKLLKEMGKEVIYGVKGKPILNDATYEDAVEVGMTELCKVIDNGSDKVGTWLEDCSGEFLKEFYGADMVISKGQANFETLSDADRDIFFLLVAKCEPIARETGRAEGEVYTQVQGGLGMIFLRCYGILGQWKDHVDYKLRERASQGQEGGCCRERVWGSGA